MKSTVSWTYVVNDLNREEITGSFCEEELQNTIQEKFRIEKVLKGKGDELYVKWKGYDNSSNSWIDKKEPERSLLNKRFHSKISQYFPKLFRSFGRNIKVKVGLSNYATKN